MQERSDAGLVGCRKGGMQEKRDAGKEGCRNGGQQEGGNQDWRDTGKVRFGTEWIQYWKDT